VTDGSIFPLSFSPIRLLLKKEFHKHHHNLVCKLINWEVRVVFDPIIEYIDNVIYDVITLYVPIEPTHVPNQLMVFFHPWNDTRNRCNVGHVIGIHLTPICLCSRIHELLPNKIFGIVLHKCLKHSLHPARGNTSSTAAIKPLQASEWTTRIGGSPIAFRSCCKNQL
jgi:hypothetical protein